MVSHEHPWLPLDRGMMPMFVDIEHKDIERAIVFGGENG